jgi:adenosine kinase
VVPPRAVVDPTGVGDGFRSGFLGATSWGLPPERAAQVGATLATLVLEADGPQEYAVVPAEFAARLGEVYGAEAAAEVSAHLPG